jgi:hypothetical protein
MTGHLIEDRMPSFDYSVKATEYVDGAGDEEG